DEPRECAEAGGESSGRIRGRRGTSRRSVAGTHRRRGRSPDRRRNDRGHRREPVAPAPVSGREGEAVSLPRENHARRKIRGGPETPLEIGPVIGPGAPPAWIGQDRLHRIQLGQVDGFHSMSPRLIVLLGRSPVIDRAVETSSQPQSPTGGFADAGELLFERRNAKTIIAIPASVIATPSPLVTADPCCIAP